MNFWFDFNFKLRRFILPIMKATKIIRYALLLFFTLLMIRITLPYLSLETDVKFLNLKQWIIHNPVWKVSFFIHVLSSIFLLIAGFTQFYDPLRKFSTVHRMVGKIYILIIVFISGPASFVMALYANGGMPSQIAFSILSILWIFFTAKAWIEIGKQNYIEHGNFMLRSYALTLSALTLRAWKYIIVLVFHPHPMDGYMIVAWLGWIPNLLIAEWLIRRKAAAEILTVNKK
jgi:uncharacterized membrane protein